MGAAAAKVSAVPTPALAAVAEPASAAEPAVGVSRVADHQDESNVPAAASAPLVDVLSGQPRDTEEARRKRIFLTAVGDVKPWGIDDPDEFIGWLKSELELDWPSNDWTPLLDALRGLDGVSLITLCEEVDTPPWFRPRRGRDGRPLRNHGVKLGSVQKLNNLLNLYGIGFYAPLFQSCDRTSSRADFIWVQKIGEGRFGQVHLVENKHRKGERSAFKLIKVENEEQLEMASQEMAHHQLASASSEFVVKVSSWGGQVADEFLFLSMEFCSGGDVRKLLNASDPPRSGLADNSLRWKLYWQICKGLEAIHAIGLIHLGINPESILLNENRDARIDLGFDLELFELRRGESRRNTLETHNGGTRGFEAPEVRRARLLVSLLMPSRG
jgi:hypothetical protein